MLKVMNFKNLVTVFATLIIKFKVVNKYFAMPIIVCPTQSTIWLSTKACLLSMSGGPPKN